jgi:sigma-54 dependent transcriptional regulator, acetoin dehydrogenase operon transcriptional activator AcoR
MRRVVERCETPLVAKRVDRAGDSSERALVPAGSGLIIVNMTTEALVLSEVSDGVWREFASHVQTHARPRPFDARLEGPALASFDPSAPATPTLSPPERLAPALFLAKSPLTPRWQRALALGASLDGPPPEEHLSRGDELKRHIERAEPVLHVASAELERAASDVSAHQYVLLLADATGVVVSTVGGGHFSEEARRVRLIPGASWSEAARGTNAIGTAIAERRPVYVRGSAHLGRRFHELVCYAAPIFDADGSLLAVLDATGMFRCADDAIGAAIVRRADAIMQALRDRAFGQAGAAVRQTLSRALDRMEGIVLLIEPPERVARMNGGARLLFGQRGEATPQALLGVDMAALTREGHHPRGLVIERGGRRFAVRVDPIQTVGGRQVALLVFLEPQRQSHPLASAPPPSAAFGAIFSRDAQLDEALTLARRIAASPLPVLLLAETGAGKELVARAIHEASDRASSPFVAVNCGAIVPSLLESELFGYGPAAFTGADRGGRRGLFAEASGGTIFLDEVAEMPPPMQVALLRILEDGTYRRVGETTAQKSDVRVVSATCRDLATMVEAGTFRRDLYYRLKGAEIGLPPLRARTDRAALAAHLLVALARKRGVLPAPRLSEPVLAAIERCTWPGNVRELQTVLDVSLILAAGSASIELEHLPPEFRRSQAVSSSPPALEVPPSAAVDLAGVEAAVVRRVLLELGGNVSLAARRLGVARSTLYRMMRRHQL